MRLPRLTTRRLMVLVALVAMGLWPVGLWMKKRRAERLEVMAKWSMWAHKYRLRQEDARGKPLNRTNQQRLDYFVDMERAWERAARYPWLSEPPPE
jgi:hypothetical protein